MATTNGMTKELANKLATPGVSLTRDEFKTTIRSFESEMAAALPLHLKKNAEKYARQALTLFSQNPKVQQCSGMSILSALMTASALGLDLTPQLGQCFIIPYDNRKKDGNKFVTVTEAQFQLGYRGVIALAMRSGELARVTAEVVCERDYFRYSKGLNPVLDHQESTDEDRGAITHVYAVANFINGGYAFEVWPVGKVVSHAKKTSKSYYKDEYSRDGKRTGNKIINDRSPWHTDFESMAKKTLIMAIWKYLPLSTEVMLAATTDETIKTVGLSEISDEKSVITLPPTVLNDDPDDKPDALPEKVDEAPAPAPAPVPASQAAPTEPEMFPLDNPTERAEKAAMANVGTELEKLRGDLGSGLSLTRTDAEAVAWVAANFDGKGMKDLTKPDLKAAIAKLNSELDRKELF
jgi:recombination protein RecT